MNTSPLHETNVRPLLLCLLFAVALTLLFWGPLWLGYGFVGGDLYPYFFPQKAFFSDRLHAGEFPLWNNLTGFGYPVLGESQTGAAYPPHLVAYYLFDVNSAYNVEHLLHYVLCFVATWLFARRVGLEASGSVLMALVFTYGWFPPRACLEWAIVTGAWLPVALWCVESFVQTRWWRYAIGLSFALGLQMLAGHFHLAFITQLLVVAYGGWRVIGSDREATTLVPSPPSSGERARVRGPGVDGALQSQTAEESPPHPNPLPPKAGGEGTRREKTKAKTEEPLTLTLSPQSRGEGTRRRLAELVMALALAIAAGFLLASVQLLPAWELKARSSRAVVGGEHEPSYGHLPPLYVSQLFLPFLWYSPIAIGDESAIRDVAEFGAPWHWFGPHHDLEAAVQRSRFGAISAATNKVEAHLYCGLVPLGLAVWWLIAGRKRRLKVEGRGLRDRAGHGSTLTLNPQPSTLNPAFWLIAGAIAVVYATGWLLPVARYVPGFNFFRGPGRYGIVTTLAIALLAGRGLDSLVARCGTLGRGLVIGLVFWSTCGDLWLVSRMVTNVAMVSQPAISFREASHVRKLLLDEPTLPRLYCPGQNVGNLLGVSCLPVYLGISPREYADPRYAGAGMPKPTDDGSPVVADEEFSTWLREAGVTHVLSFSPLDESTWRVTLVWSGMDEMLNRAWGRPEPLYLYRLGKDMEGLLPGRVWFPAHDDGIRDNEATVDVPAQAEANRIVIGTEFRGATPLELRELGFPGWQVQIDDQPAVANVNGFRSVVVPHGEHRVTWTYRPRSVSVGAALSLFALCMLAGLGHLRFWHRERLDRCWARVFRGC